MIADAIPMMKLRIEAQEDFLKDPPDANSFDGKTKGARLSALGGVPCRPPRAASETFLKRGRGYARAHTGTRGSDHARVSISSDRQVHARELPL